MHVLRRTLSGLRWHVIGYGFGLFAWAAVIVLLYPEIRDAYANVELPEAYSALFGDAVLDFSDFRNFASIEFYQWVPLVMTIYVVTAATGTLAGDEARGLLEVLLTQPRTRTRIFFEKAAAILIGALTIAAITALGLAVTLPLIDDAEGISVVALVVYVFATLPFVLLVGSFSLLLAVVAPTRGSAAAIAAGVVVASWLVASLADLSAQTEWLKYLSGYYYADVHEIPKSFPGAQHMAVLFVATAAQLALAAIGFQRREIEVGTWQFHVRDTTTVRAAKRAA